MINNRTGFSFTKKIYRNFCPKFQYAIDRIQDVQDKNPKIRKNWEEVTSFQTYLPNLRNLENFHGLLGNLG